MKYKNGSHSKYRKIVLTEAVKDPLEKLFRYYAEINDWSLSI